MGVACRTYEEEEKVYTGFWWGKLRERDQLEDPCADGRLILTLRLLMSYIYIYIYIYMELLVKPEMLTSYIYIYMDLRLATLKQSLSICCTMFQH